MLSIIAAVPHLFATAAATTAFPWDTGGDSAESATTNHTLELCRLEANLVRPPMPAAAVPETLGASPAHSTEAASPRRRRRRAALPSLLTPASSSPSEDEQPTRAPAPALDVSRASKRSHSADPRTRIAATTFSRPDAVREYGMAFSPAPAALTERRRLGADSSVGAFIRPTRLPKQPPAPTESSSSNECESTQTRAVQRQRPFPFGSQPQTTPRPPFPLDSPMAHIPIAPPGTQQLSEPRVMAASRGPRAVHVSNGEVAPTGDNLSRPPPPRPAAIASPIPKQRSKRNALQPIRAPAGSLAATVAEAAAAPQPLLLMRRRIPPRELPPSPLPPPHPGHTEESWAAERPATQRRAAVAAVAAATAASSVLSLLGGSASAVSSDSGGALGWRRPQDQWCALQGSTPRRPHRSLPSTRYTPSPPSPRSISSTSSSSSPSSSPPRSPAGFSAACGLGGVTDVSATPTNDGDIVADGGGGKGGGERDGDGGSGAGEGDDDSVTTADSCATVERRSNSPAMRWNMRTAAARARSSRSSTASPWAPNKHTPAKPFRSTPQRPTLLARILPSAASSDQAVPHRAPVAPSIPVATAPSASLLAAPTPADARPVPQTSAPSNTPLSVVLPSAIPPLLPKSPVVGDPAFRPSVAIGAALHSGPRLHVGTGSAPCVPPQPQERVMQRTPLPQPLPTAPAGNASAITAAAVAIVRALAALPVPSPPKQQQPVPPAHVRPEGVVATSTMRVEETQAAEPVPVGQNSQATAPAAASLPAPAWGTSFGNIAEVSLLCGCPRPDQSHIALFTLWYIPPIVGYAAAHRLRSCAAPRRWTSHWQAIFRYARLRHLSRHPTSTRPKLHWSHVSLTQSCYLHPHSRSPHRRCPVRRHPHLSR